MKGNHEMQMRSCDSLVEAAVDMLDSGISEEALPLGLAPLFDPDPFHESNSLTWSIH
jgi:hypothetical protein